MSESMRAADLGEESWLDLWIVRGARWVVRTARPWLGWGVLACCVGLAQLPGLLLWESEWLRAVTLQGAILGSGLLAVLVAWAILGWRRPFERGPGWLRRVMQLLLYIGCGALVISQFLGAWLPTVAEWQQAIFQRAWPALGEGVRMDLGGLAARYALWWQGVSQNTPVRDDLILATLASALNWFLAGLLVWIVRRTGQGLLGALPILWPVGLVMLYSPAQRWLFVAAVALALVLHLLLDQQRLVRQWQAERLDYSPSLLTERAGVALSGMALALAVALLMPNLYIYDITAAYYHWLRPFNQQAEGAVKRLFPGLAGGVAPGAEAGGLSGQLLLGGSPELGDRPVLQVRTSEPQLAYDAPPRGHNLRGMTFASYDGLRWSNPNPMVYQTLNADEPWHSTPPTGRRSLLQSVNLLAPGATIFAAGEPAAPSIAYRAQERSPGDLVSLAGAGRSYTILSQVPALADTELAALPAWEPATNPLPPAYAIHLELPASVTQRTRELALTITQGITTPFGQASAIETYLRQFPYDLDAPAPPATATDVADFFLFDLQRGYCDYYATAFVVLARAIGLPARFASGYAPGNWSLTERAWTVTEAEAHSWPEVFFPGVGWIPFEPTAGRPQLVRTGNSNSAQVAVVTDTTFEPLAPVNAPDAGPLWAWLFLGALVAATAFAAVIGWRSAHEDPWQGLLRWGRRAGRPLGEGETPLEYGQGLAQHVQTTRAREPELGRTVARSIEGLSTTVSTARYAPATVRPAHQQEAVTLWKRLRSYLRRL